MSLVILVKSALVLFAIVNPIGSIPIFLQLTDKMAPESRRQVFKTAVLTSVAILFLFILVGKWVLVYFFRIQLPDLIAAGGLLLLLIAIDQLIFGALVKGVLDQDKAGARHIGAVPMACPILAGPGAMMTAFVIFSEQGFLVAAFSIIIVMGITWVLLYFNRRDIQNAEVVCLVLSKILCLLPGRR